MITYTIYYYDNNFITITADNILVAIGRVIVDYEVKLKDITKIESKRN